jgi:hypothetical protein
MAKQNNGIGGALLAGLAGAAVIGGLILARQDSAEQERRDREARQACQVIGAVHHDCPDIVPDIEVCQVEDCSDIRGDRGFWRDPSDRRQTWLVMRPGLQDAPQNPSES